MMSERRVGIIGALWAVVFGWAGILLVFPTFGFFIGLDEIIIPAGLTSFWFVTGIPVTLSALLLGRRTALAITEGSSKPVAAGVQCAIRVLVTSAFLIGIYLLVQDPLISRGIIKWQIIGFYLVFAPVLMVTFGLLPALGLGALYGMVLSFHFLR